MQDIRGRWVKVRVKKRFFVDDDFDGIVEFNVGVVYRLTDIGNTLVIQKAGTDYDVWFEDIEEFLEFIG